MTVLQIRLVLGKCLFFVTSSGADGKVRCKNDGFLGIGIGLG